MQIEEFRTNVDAIKRVSPNDVEYWMARDIQQWLGYGQWRNFESVIEKAMTASESAGVKSANHFAKVSKMVEAGSGIEVERADYYLTRFACYLIAMNGDIRKTEIGLAQAYFVIQTRRQEEVDMQSEDEKRLALRDRVKINNKFLASAAKKAGVLNFGIFQNEGYRGLYGGKGLKEIKKMKGIPEKEDLLDRISRTELAANDFRITQTEEQLESVRGENEAVKLHGKIGREVRETIRKINGTMPENLAAEPHIKSIKKKIKSSTGKILKSND